MFGRGRIVKEPGALLASGRDADIFEYGPGLVVRRTRTGRSLDYEARAMEYARAQGFPVPAVVELSDDGASIVMERLDGMDMVAVLAKRPWTVSTQGRVLAELHRRLHEIDAPDWLRPSPVGKGDKLLHLDLHPLNVMVTPKGPMVIDWTGACAGEPEVDVALAWVLLSAGAIPGGRLLSRVLGAGRALLVRSFLASVDRGAAARRLEEVVAWKVSDPHMSEAEQARMWDLVRKASPPR